MKKNIEKLHKIEKSACKVLFFILLIVTSLHTVKAGDVVTSHGISFFSSLKYPENFTNFDYVNPNAPKGGGIRLASIGTFDTLNPYILKGVSADGLGLMFDSLMVNSADEAGSTYGLIAESAEMASDRTYVIFNLRDIATFSDGTPVLAEDVKFTFDTLMSKGHPQYQAYYKEISEVKILGKRRVKFVFASNKNRELPLVASQLPVLSKTFFNDKEFAKGDMKPLLGSGPYMIKQVEAGRSIVYERRKDYWAKDLPVNRGKYNFDEIRIDYYRDATVAVEALKAGEYDFRRENISKVWAKAYNVGQLDTGEMIKKTLPDGTPTGMQCFALNLRRSMFKDIRVREAFAYAYDFEWANEQLFHGAYARNTSFYGNSQYASEGLPSAEERKLLAPFKDQLPSRLYTQAYIPPATDGSGNNRANLIKARDLLEEAGWMLKDMKRIDPETGRPVEIEFLLHSPSFERVVAPFVRSLKKLGIDATIRTVDTSQYIKRVQEFDYDIVVHWFTQSALPGNEQMDYWHSSNAEVDGSRNIIGIKNPAADAMVEAMIRADNMEELKTAARALDRVLLWNFYAIPQWYSRTHRVIYWNKIDHPKKIAPYDLGMPETWWAKE